MSDDPSLTLPNFANTRIAFQSKSDEDLKQTAILFRLMNRGWLVKIGTQLGKIALTLRLPLAETIIRRTIFKQFCGGISLADCQETIDHLHDYDTLTILDYGAEAKSEAHDLEMARVELINAIEFAASNNSVPVVVCKLTALVPNEILEKKQIGSPFSEHESELYNVFLERIYSIATRAAELKVGLFIDAEESWIQSAIDHVAQELMVAFNRDRVIIYTTYQMYRKDKLAQLISDHHTAQREGYILGAKLVRGAYMDKERAYAQEKGIPSLIQDDKTATDRDFDAAVSYCLDAYQDIAMCNASHNLNSALLMTQKISDKRLPKNHQHLNFCQLLGMSDHLTFNLAQAGFNTAKYVVYGPVKDVAEYLIRRAEENTAVTGEMSRELHLIEEELERRGL